MAKNGKKKKRVNRLNPDKPADFNFNQNDKVNEVKPEQLKATKNETVGFNNNLTFDVVILLYGPPFVLTTAPNSTDPAGIPLSDGVRAIFVKAGQPSDT